MSKTQSLLQSHITKYVQCAFHIENSSNLYTVICWLCYSVQDVSIHPRSLRNMDTLSKWEEDLYTLNKVQIVVNSEFGDNDVILLWANIEQNNQCTVQNFKCWLTFSFYHCCSSSMVYLGQPGSHNVARVLSNPQPCSSFTSLTTGFTVWATSPDLISIAPDNPVNQNLMATLFQKRKCQIRK